MFQYEETREQIARLVYQSLAPYNSVSYDEQPEKMKQGPLEFADKVLALDGIKPLISLAQALDTAMAAADLFLTQYRASHPLPRLPGTM